uniref:condensation domain-containing protein n=1 Tax=Pelomonas sp. BJYL3 TaxID=2976697 RepID=UPI0022B4F13B
GDGVARGYLNQPQLTEERFVADPFSEEAGARMYKTGDLGRWLADGTIEYLGRNDFQVKIRGFRIELGEIEAKLAALGAEDAGDVVVLAREDGAGDQPGGKRLVAYYTGTASAEQLRAQAQATLPSYMVPAAYVQLASLPLTPNGKLDRKALPAPDEQAWSRRAYEAPQGEVEATLAALWAELLQIERVGRHDNFFELGGHSLLAVQLASRVRKSLGLELPLAELFAHPELAALAARLHGADRADAQPIPRAPRELPLPLSLAQQRLWFLSRMDASASQAYHISGAVRLRGALDAAALRQALQAIIERHESLRTRFELIDGEPRQIIEAQVALPLLELPASGLDDPLFVRHEAEAFDLRQAPALRVLLARLGPDDHVLQIVMHHIICDGWSIGVLLAELSSAYAAQCGEASQALPALPIQYADYAVWQRAWLADGRLEAQTAFWRQALAEAPVLLELPTDHERPLQQDYRGEQLGLQLDAPLSAALKALSRRHGVTLYMTLLAGWAALLGRLASQTDVVIGSPVAGRGRAEVEPLIGCFINTLALRLKMDDEPTVAQLLAHTRAQVLAAQQHQDLPFEQVVEAVQPPRSMAHTPLFQAAFSWQNQPEGELKLPGLTLEAAQLERRSAQFDLTLTLQEVEGVLAGHIEYAAALFERSTIERWTGHLRTLLQAMAADDSQPVARLPLMGPAERRQVLEQFNATASAYEREACVHELIEAQARRQPQAVAVEYEGQACSYAQLNAQANRLARQLRQLGVGPDARVAVCTGRSLAMVVAQLAVLKAGGA